MKEDTMQPAAPLPAEAPGQAEARKGDHIELAFRSRTESGELDRRFSYEPLLAAHPPEGDLAPLPFLGKTLRVPLWVSSMTGGARHAFQINTTLARACRRFGMGMGLGSCRSLLHGDAHLADFDVRDLIGEDLPLYANLGVAQIEALQDKEAMHLVEELLRRLRADGLIVHVNPLQEWFQPEGDRFRRAPLTTLHRLLDQATYPVIVKEVGQGMGYESLRHLLHLPLAAVDFGAAGGTNFALLENLRRSDQRREHWAPMVRVGHDAADMVAMVNRIHAEAGGELACRQIIISGGVRDFLDGYHLTASCALPSVYGQASAMLRHALQGDDALDAWLQDQLRGLEMARAYLRVNPS
jgi:isopentenyl-diphosphate Delta-isomerase